MTKYTFALSTIDAIALHTTRDIIAQWEPNPRHTTHECAHDRSRFLISNLSASSQHEDWGTQSMAISRTSLHEPAERKLADEEVGALPRLFIWIERPNRTLAADAAGKLHVFHHVFHHASGALAMNHAVFEHV